MLYYYILYAFIGYFIGSIPFGYLIVKMVKGIDVRTVGSGNVGATNVGRAAGWQWGAFCFLLDVNKGFFPVFAALVYHARLTDSQNITMTVGLPMGLGLIVGHLFPIYLGFKGGKGVATSLGVFIILTYFYPTLFALFAWVLIFLLFRYVSLASIIAAISLPVFYWLNGRMDPKDWELPIMVACIAVALLVIVRHISNIRRIFNGTEPKVYFGIKKKTAQPKLPSNPTN